MIDIAINGQKYSGFEDVTVTKSIDTLCGTFSFTTSHKAITDFPIKQNDECVIFVESEPVINGYIEVFEISYDSESDSIVVSGRDKTADLVDSSLGPDIVINGPISLEKICSTVLKSIGSDITVRTDDKIDSFKANEIFASKIGHKAFEFLEKYARLRQVIMTTDGTGNLFLTRSKNIPMMRTNLVSRQNGTGNNILSASSTSNYTKRFHKYNFYSQGNPAAEMMDWDHPRKPTPKQISNVSDNSTDTSVRTSRVFNHKQKKSSDKPTIKNRADWENRIRKSRSFSYTATVVGFTAINDGEIWKINKLVHVEDEKANLFGTFILNSITYSLSNSEGSTTTMNFIDKDSYDLELEAEKNSQEMVW